jgi:hypothetical protein
VNGAAGIVNDVSEHTRPVGWLVGVFGLDVVDVDNNIGIALSVQIRGHQVFSFNDFTLSTHACNRDS